MSQSQNLIELAGGYIRTPAGVQKEKGPNAHFNRAAGRYIGTIALTPVIGFPAGWAVDHARRKVSITKTRSEQVRPAAEGKGYAMNTRLNRLITLNARTDSLMEFEKRILPNGQEAEDDNPSSAPAFLAGTGAGIAGVLGHQSIKSRGGYGATYNRVATASKSGFVDAAKASGAEGGSVFANILKGLKGGVKSAAHAYSSRQKKLIELNQKTDEILEFDIMIKKENKGKFTATKKKTGKTTGQLRHSKNKLTKKRAVFAANSRQWAKNRKKRHHMSALLDNLIQFDTNAAATGTPIGEFKRDYKKMGDALRAKLHKESYVRRGALIGAGTGSAAGTGAGVLLARSIGEPRGTRGWLGAAGAIYGGLVGAGLGAEIGGSHRRKQPLP